jgi:protein TonB
MMNRYLIATILAFAITFSLFIGMRYLIVGGENALTDPIKGRVIDFVRLKKDEAVESKQRKPKKPPKPEEPPPDVKQPPIQQNSLDTDSQSMSFSPNIQANTQLKSGLSLQSGDGDYLPIVKVAPIYPRRALSRGIEGYVIVEFTVTKNGSVKAPVVIEAQPENIFNQSAIDAALKFKYKPRVIDGVFSEVSGVQNKITFKMR